MVVPPITISIPNILPPSADKPFYRYEVQITQEGRTWTVARRYSSFEDFHKRINKRLKKFYDLPKLPKKKLSNNKDQKFLHQRRLELMSYMTNIVRIEAVRESSELDILLFITKNRQRSSLDPNFKKHSLPAQGPPPMDLFRTPQGQDAPIREDKKKSLKLGHVDKSSFSSEYNANKKSDSESGIRSSFFYDAKEGLPSSSDGEDRTAETDQSESSEDSYGSEEETPSYQNYNEVYTEFPLHYSVETGNIKQVKEILTNSPSLLDQVDSEFRTALHIATMKGNFEIVTLLLALGADLTITTRDKDTILHIAAKSKSAKILEKLLEKEMVDVNFANNNGMTPLHILSKHVPKSSDTNLLRVLLNRGAVSNCPDADGVLPLHYCAATGKVAWCDKLLREHPEDIDRLDKFRNSPLHYAARYTQNEVVSLLIEKGANILAKGKDDCTPLDLVYQARSARNTQTDQVSLTYVDQNQQPIILY